MEMNNMYNKISPQEEDPTRPLQTPPPAPPQRQSAWMNFCVGFLMVFSIFSVGREIKHQFGLRPSLSNQVAVNRDFGSWDQALDSIVTPETVEALGNDARLKRTIMSMVEFTVDLSDQLAARYESPGLEETKEALQEYKNIIKRSLGDLEDDDAKSGSETEPEKRQLPGLGDLFPGIGGGGGGASGGGNMSAGILSGLLQPLTDGLKNIGSQLVRNLDGPGMFLGIGVGAGAAQGLNLSTQAEIMQVAAKVAADNKMEATGLNPAIQNLGVGLTATIVGSVNLSDLSGVGGNLTQQLQPIALALATGIGNGTVAGLKLNPNAANLEPVNDSSIANVVGTFGFGLTKTLTSNIDTSNLLNGGSDLTRRLVQILPDAASGLGNGLGEGATVGLGLQPDVAVVMRQMPDGSIDFGGVTHTFAKALTNSLLRNGTADELLKKFNLSGSDTTRRIMDILPAAASGLGKGLGEGATVGLGLQPDVAVVMRQMPDGSIDFGGVTHTFAKALTSSFLQNGTANELVSKIGGAAKSAVNGGGIPKTIDINGQTVEIGKAAQGFARGFIQAAGDSIQSMGGVQSIFEGNATIPTGPPPDPKIDFDDTIGGAATGFGSGIGGQGVVVVYGLIKNPHGTNTTAASAAPALPATSAPAARRDLELVAREDPPPIVSVDTSNGFNLSVVINAQTVSAAAQAGVNALSCQGIGGLGLIGLGLIRSNTIALDMFSGGGGGGNSNITKVIKQVIPTGTIKIANEGHFYAIDGGILRDSLDGSITKAANAIEINGSKLPSWIAFLVIHIIFAIVAYINILPLAIGLEHLRNILVRVNMPQALPKVHKWNNIMWLFVMGPSVLLVFLFGALVTAKSAHFRTAHGVISLITTLVGLGAVLLHLAVKARAPPELPRSTRSTPPPLPLMSLPNIRLLVNQLFLALSFASVITGFTDLSSVALCFTQIVPFDVALVVGFGLSTVFVLGSSISGLDLALTVRDIMKRRKGGPAGSSGVVERGGDGLQGKISAPKIVKSNKEKGSFM